MAARNFKILLNEDLRNEDADYDVFILLCSTYCIGALPTALQLAFSILYVL
jgi:hypothetical protein